jgi:WhiB family redox-sensing transcriptional regulator
MSIPFIEVRDWHRQAQCVGLNDLMYPDKGDRQGEHEARRVCRRCPVALDCLAESLEKRDFQGVRAGFNGRERELIAGGAPIESCERCNVWFVAQWPNQIRCRVCSQAVRGAA